MPSSPSSSYRGWPDDTTFTGLGGGLGATLGATFGFTPAVTWCDVCKGIRGPSAEPLRLKGFTPIIPQRRNSSGTSDGGERGENGLAC